VAYMPIARQRQGKKRVSVDTSCQHIPMVMHRHPYRKQCFFFIWPTLTVYEKDHWKDF
jgi:hypothetical protein